MVFRSALPAIGLSCMACPAAFAAETKPESGRPALASGIDIFGRVLYDYSIIRGRNSDFRLDDGELRTARIGASGKLFPNTKFKIEVSLDDRGDAVLTDAYLEYKGAGGPVLRLGQFKTPNSFNEMTSGRFTPAQERAAFTDAFGLDRRIGVSLNGKGGRHTYSVGVFGQNIEASDSLGGYAVAGRITYAPAIGVSSLQTHLGISARYRRAGDQEPQLRYRQRPVVHLPGRIIGTERISNADLFIGVEAALAKGPFWAAGEYAVSFVECSVCSANPAFTGGYVETGVMMGGERAIKGAKFSRPKVYKSVENGGLGAVGLTARFDQINLGDKSIDGGSYNSFTLGVDYWPTSHLRLGVNGFIADADLGATLSGLDAQFASAILAGATSDVVRGLSFRAQLDF